VTTPSAPIVSSGVRTAAIRAAADADRSRVRTGVAPAEAGTRIVPVCGAVTPATVPPTAGRVPGAERVVDESSRCRRVTDTMTTLRIRDAARYLGVSDDTVRRLVDAGTLPRSEDPAGRTVVEGSDLAAYVRGRDAGLGDPSGVRSSARNRFVGIVTDLVVEGVVAQVELQAGPNRVVSLMTAEAVRDLGLEVGSVAVASVKATMVTVEVPERPERAR